MTSSLARRQILGAGLALGATALVSGTAQASPRADRSGSAQFPLPNG